MNKNIDENLRRLTSINYLHETIILISEHENRIECPPMLHGERAEEQYQQLREWLQKKINENGEQWAEFGDDPIQKFHCADDISLFTVLALTDATLKMWLNDLEIIMS